MKDQNNKLIITVDKTRASKDSQVMLNRSDLEFSDEVKSIELKLKDDKTNPSLWMEKGLALSKQMLFREATEAYSMGLSYDPFNWALLRHRGHRFLSTYRFEDGAADFELASRLNSNDWNVWYHLGLSYYLLGDFERANTAYEKCLSITDMTGIDLVAIVNWKYLTMMRLGKKSEAKKLLNLVTEDTEAGENQAYKEMVLVYKGELSVEEALKFSNEGFEALEYSTRGYGIAMNLYLHGKKKAAQEILDRIYADDGFWSAFGYLGTYVEIANNRL